MQLVQGYCTKHKTGEGNPMPKVDRNGESVCMFCDSELTPKTGVTSNVADPGDEEMRRVLAKSGVAVPPNTGKAPMPDVPKPFLSKPAVTPGIEVNAKEAQIPVGADFDARVKMALGIMKGLPMPSDVKQFKAIQKIIAGMENLVGEK